MIRLTVYSTYISGPLMSFMTTTSTNRVILKGMLIEALIVLKKGVGS